MESSSSGERRNVLPAILTATVLPRARSTRSADLPANQRIAEWCRLPERKMQADRWQSPAGLMPKLMQRLGLTRAPARNRSDRRLVKNRRRLHRRALRPGRIARRHSLRPRPPTRIALRARTNLQVRNPAKTKTTLRRQNHPRHPFSCRLTGQY